jgi:hypothetical protein
VSGGAVVQRNGKLLVFLDTGESFPLRATVEDDVMRLEGTLNGTPHTAFDSAKDIIRLKPATEMLRVKAEY